MGNIYIKMDIYIIIYIIIYNPMIIMMIVAGHKQRHMKSDSNRPATFSTSKAVIQAWWELSTGVW